MNIIELTQSRYRTPVVISGLVLTCILFSMGFACATPLAAFATISAMLFGRSNALLATASIWLVNQFWGFAFHNYPLKAETFAWGVALGIISILCCLSAKYILRQIPGVTGIAIAFMGSFFVYEGSLFAIDLIGNRGADIFTFAIVTRIFLINLGAFVGLVVLKETISFASKTTTAPAQSLSF